MLKKLHYSPGLTLSSNILYAPLAGCTDVPMRRMAACYQPGLMFCEMLKMDALVRRHPGTLAMAKFQEQMRPIGAQLVGSKPELAPECAQIVESLGFDAIDLNCGCPVDKVTKDGSGSGLLKQPERIGELVSALRTSCNLPVSVKIRLGWDDDSICVEKLVAIAEAAGAVAITIHTRTREQAYSGKARWEWLKIAKQAAEKILIIGNGDIFTPEDAARMFEETGVDGILCARGTMGNPWLVEQIRDHLQGKPYQVRNSMQRLEALIEHFKLACEEFPERKALLDLRRFGAWYLHSQAGARQLRHQLNSINSCEDAYQLLQQLLEQELATSAQTH